MSATDEALEFDEDVAEAHEGPLSLGEAAAAQRERDGLAVQVPPDELVDVNDLLVAASAAEAVRGNTELSDKHKEAACRLTRRLKGAEE